MPSYVAVPTLVRSAAANGTLVAAEPFAAVPVAADTRLYPTFLPARATADPPPAPPPGCRIVRAGAREVLSVLDLDWGRTGDLMAVLERSHGGDVTTRSWNTLVRIAGAGA